MRMLLNVSFPPEPFNTAVRDGTVGSKVKAILEVVKPEVIYFTEQNGRRGAVMVVDLKEPSHVPVLAEPWFLAFNADVELRIAMTPEDLAKSGIDAMGKKW